MYEFKLYVVGRTPKSTAAIDELKTLLTGAFNGHYHLKVIYIIENPEEAEKNKVLATPTLEKVSPEPVRKVIGDLSNSEMVLFALGLTAE